MAHYKQDLVDIELNSGNIHRSFLNHSIGSGDVNANRFGIRIFRDGEPVDLSGASCYGYFRNNHGDNIALTSYGTVSGNVAYVTLPQACYNYEGQFCLSIKLIGDGVTGTMRIVDGVVDNTHTGSAVAPTGAVPTYSEIISQYDAMVAATAMANGAIATTFNAATVYPAGSYVINDGALYLIVEDHEANVTWANTNKATTTIGVEVSLLSNKISAIADIKFNYFDKTIATSGKFIDGEIGETYHYSDNSAYYCMVMPVIPGKTYVLAKTNYRWLELDASGTILDRHGTSNEATELKVRPIAAGVAYIAFSWAYKSPSSYMVLDPGVSFSTYIPYPYSNALIPSIITNSNIVTGNDIDIVKTNKIYNEIAVYNNYFDKANALDGYFYDGENGETIHTASNSAYACIIIPVEKGKTYVLQRTDYRWNELDENDKILERHGSAVAVTQLSITPNTTGVKKVAFSWIKSNVPIDSYMVLDPGVSFSQYIPYPYTVIMSKDMLEASGLYFEKTYLVGSGGDFATFSEMLVALKDDTSNKVVYVKTGVYDIFTEMGGQAYIESIDTSDDWSVVNNIVPQNTKIIGVGDVVLQYKPTDAQIIDHSHGWLMSPLNIIGSCEIENIAIDCSNCRYAIHIESASGGMDANTAKVVLRNVRAHRAVTTLMGDHQTVGTGIGYNARWTFEDCRFTSDGTSAIFSVHTNAPGVNSKAVVMLKDCVITSSHNNAHTSKLVNFISQYLPVAITNIANVSNCFVNGKIGTETTITNRQSYDIDVIGGASYGLVDAATQTSGYTINNCGNVLLN